MFYRAALLAACLAAVSCSRSTVPAGIQRVAVLRFENLSGDPSIDWMGRAFAEIITRELTGPPAIYALPPARVLGLQAAVGPRPGGAPGISAEKDLALAAGANRLMYGEYWLRAGRLEARVTVENSVADNQMPVIAASASAGDVLGAAGRLARQFSSRSVAYPTASNRAVEAYTLGLEAPAAAQAIQHWEQAEAADPNFGPAYDLAAQMMLQQRDRAGALALLGQGMAHAAAMPQLERAQLAFTFASLRGDAAARQRALAELSAAAPTDPAVWRVIAESANAQRQYTAAVQAYRKALLVEPDDAALLNEFGYAAAYAGELPEATAALQRYAVLRPGDANAQDSLGDVNLLLGHLREAENFYLQAARKDPAFQAGGDLRKAAMARLMTGDVAGAETLDQQFLQARAAVRDPLVDFYRAEWLWTTGRRREAAERLEAFARTSANGPLKQAASEAYSELSVWSLATGKRETAAQLADHAAALAGLNSAATAAVARFLVQPSAKPEEWAARADRAFPQPAQQALKNLALAYALLLGRHFSAAGQILRTLYAGAAAPGNDQSPLLLAWADLESGNTKEAAGLLRFNPIPPGAVTRPFDVFFFPRLFYLRGRLAAQAGNPQQARDQFRLFLKLSGDTPLIWGEEAQAH